MLTMFNYNNYNSYYNGNNGMNQADPHKQPPQPLQPSNSHQSNMQYSQAQQGQSLLQGQKQHIPPLPQQNQSLPSIFANLPQQDSGNNNPSGAQFLAYSASVPQLPPTPFTYDYPTQFNSANTTNTYSSQPRPYSALPVPQSGSYGSYYQYNNPAAGAAAVAVAAAAGSGLPVLPSNSQRYPLSPLTIQSDRDTNNNASKSSTGSVKASSTSPPDIDYSSLVSYTISRSIRRKRRKKATDASPLNPVESFPCEVCNKVFQKHYNLKSHMKTHSTDKPYKCGHCFKTFARSHDKKRHELLHNGIKNFKCEGYLQDGVTKWGCGKKFARSDALSRHFRTETGWLCIRPLMDEAKRLEDAGISSSISVPVAAGAIIPNGSSVGSMATPTTSSNARSPNGEEYYDNSSLIKKLIQSK